MKSKLMATLFSAIATLVVSASDYPMAGTGVELNQWTRNYSGVMAAARKDGYPVLMVVVDSSSCGHCHLMMQNTINTADFAAIEQKYKFYKVLLDYPYAGASSDWDYAVNHYLGYFDYGMYPLVAVLRKDGSVYGHFGNSTTDNRGVAKDLYQLIEKLTLEQIGSIDPDDAGKKDSGKNDPAPIVIPTAGELGTRYKGSYVGVLAANGNAAGSVTMKISAKGAATLAVVTRQGKEKVKAELSGDDKGGINCLSENDGLSLSYDKASGCWLGVWGKYSLVAKVKGKGGSSAFFTAVARCGSAGGYLTCAQAKGKLKLAGNLGGSGKVSANCEGVEVPGTVAGKYFAKLVPVGGSAFVGYVRKNGQFEGGVAASGNGVFTANLNFGGAEWTAQGNAWNQSQNLTVYDGKVLKIAAIGEEIKVIAVNDKKLAAGDNSYSCKLKAQVKKGTFSGSLKGSAGKGKFEGVLLVEGGVFSGFGTANVGGSTSTATIR